MLQLQELLLLEEDYPPKRATFSTKSNMLSNKHEHLISDFYMYMESAKSW